MRLSVLIILFIITCTIAEGPSLKVHTKQTSATFLLADIDSITFVLDSNASIYPDSLYVIQPRATTTYHPGDTVMIKWKYPSYWSYTEVKLRLYKNKLNNPIRWLTPLALNYPNGEYRWVILKSDTGSQCNIIVSEYDDNLTANSGVFTVSPK